MYKLEVNFVNIINNDLTMKCNLKWQNNVKKVE